MVAEERAACIVLVDQDGIREGGGGFVDPVVRRRCAGSWRLWRCRSRFGVPELVVRRNRSRAYTTGRVLSAESVVELNLVAVLEPVVEAGNFAAV